MRVGSTFWLLVAFTACSTDERNPGVVRGVLPVRPDSGPTELVRCTDESTQCPRPPNCQSSDCLDAGGGGQRLPNDRLVNPNEDPPPPPSAGRPLGAVVAGGARLTSPRYSLTLSTGQAPGGNGTYRSPRFTLRGGLVGATDN